MKLDTHYLLRGLLGLALAALISSAAPQDSPRVRPRLQIINGSAQTLDVFWLKSDAERVPNGSIAPGRDSFISTTIGHRFVIVGRDDQSETTVSSVVPVQGIRIDSQSPDGVPPFYTQRGSANGYPIVASPSVNAYAVAEAAYLVNLMLAKRPDVRDAMIQSGSRLCIMAWNEFTTDLPEFARLSDEKLRDFPGLPGKDYWDARARGLGGSTTDPFCSCAEENLLGYPGDPYSTENILIHEFAHNIHLRGLVNVDPTFDARLKKTYDDAVKAGLWKGKYAGVNHHEYFAEGVQSWFDNNRENDFDHNHVNTRAELVEYDSGLASMCREVFGDTELKYSKPATRLSGHLAGYDPAKAPTFVWPKRLQNAMAQIRRQAQARSEAGGSVKAAASGSAKNAETRTVRGWTLHINLELIRTEPRLTERAVELLDQQLQEITKVVPQAAVAELRKVPLYFSPEYSGRTPTAEFHPDPGWLSDNGRDPGMAQGIEFTNIRIFERELNRMPNFALHELAHAYHFRVLGTDNPQIVAAFEKAKASGKYDRVERRFGNGEPNRFERAYALENPAEYFAECTEAYFATNDYFPFCRDELERHDPEMFELLGKLWNVERGSFRP
jgi:hypothetical protein